MSSIKQQVVVMSAQQYDMVNEETGEQVAGTSVRFALNGDLAPVFEEGFKGYKLAKSTVTFNNFHDFVEVPGIYEADINFNIAADGKVRVSAANFQFKKSLAPAGK